MSWHLFKSLWPKDTVDCPSGSLQHYFSLHESCLEMGDVEGRVSLPSRVEQVVSCTKRNRLTGNQG